MYMYMYTYTSVLLRIKYIFAPSHAASVPDKQGQLQDNVEHASMWTASAVQHFNQQIMHDSSTLNFLTHQRGFTVKKRAS